MSRITILFLLVGALTGPAFADPRVDHADTLLSSEATYGEAIALYEEVLAEHPENERARLGLARVQSWQGSYETSLGHYDALLRNTPEHYGWRLERASVRSWAGQYEPALRELRALVVEAPDDPAPAAQLARVLAWSGRTSEADRAYARALDMAEDPELRAEWLAIRRGHGPEVRLFARRTSDSTDFVRRSLLVTPSFFLDLDTRVYGRVGAVRVAQPRARNTAVADGWSFPRSDRAVELAVGVERTLEERWKGSAEIALRDWDYADSLVFGYLDLDFTQNESTVWSLELRREGQVDASDSFAALVEDEFMSRGVLSLWKGLSEHWSLFTAVDIGHISGGNDRQRLDLSIAFDPDPAADSELVFSTSYTAFDDETPLYYSPERDLGVALDWNHGIPLAPNWRFVYGAGFGVGRTDEAGVEESGPTYRGTAGLVWAHETWRARLQAWHSTSRRAERYRSNTFELRIGRSF